MQRQRWLVLSSRPSDAKHGMHNSWPSAMQVIPEVVHKVTEKAELIISYNGKPISNGEELTPSETQVSHIAATFPGCCLAEQQ